MAIVHGVKGDGVRFVLPALSCVVLTGCAATAAPAVTPVPTRGATAAPAVTRVATARPTAPPTARPATIALDPRYLAFVGRVCSALAARNAPAVSSVLMNYQYNTGLRWGMMGDGEGQSSSPGLLGTWLQGSQVHCVSVTTDSAGHGAVLTSGWSQPAASAIIEFDRLNGAWKINDFTFGTPAILGQAIHVNTAAVVPYPA